MSAVSELRKGVGRSIKGALFGGYDRTATEELVAALSSQLIEAQENYGSRIEEIKARADALQTEKTKLLAKEKELSEQVKELSEKNMTLVHEQTRVASEYGRLQESLSRFSAETGLSVEGYAELCHKCSQAEDENAALKAQVQELKSALAAKLSENAALREAYGKTLSEKDSMREELYASLADAREERNQICGGFIDAAARQREAAAALQSALTDAMRLLDGLTLDAASAVASLHSRTN